MRTVTFGRTGRYFRGMEEPLGVALLFELDLETMEEVSVDPLYAFDRRLVDRCFGLSGRHAHIYLLVCKERTEELNKALDALLDEYETVSWWSKKHRRFCMKKGRI